ncbi:LysR family transcriptional regulator [Vibrio sp. YIC-376]|uniref:LysR family transcriptional regulator n=1 Tax=Vibrio sp. YIC-376 TaxID=3136162 RepID=UPI00402A9C53
MYTEDLALFVTVAESGSQSAAARSLNVPVSKISRRIAQLEDSLGTRLFDRTTRNLTLTESGDELLERSRLILEEIEELQLSVGQLRNNPSGVVTIAAPLDFINLTISHLLPDLYEQYPGIKLQFISYQSRQNPMTIQADLILYVDHDAPPDSSLIGHHLVTLPRHFIASPTFIARYPDLKHPSQLTDYPCLLTAKGSLAGNHWLWQDQDGIHKVAVDGPFESESIDLCISGSLNSLGVTWIPSLFCAGHLEHQKLQLLFDGQYATDVTLWGFYPSRRYLPYRVKIVLEFLRHHFELIQQNYCKNQKSPS